MVANIGINKRKNMSKIDDIIWECWKTGNEYIINYKLNGILEKDHQESLQQLIHENGMLRSQLDQKIEKLTSILAQKVKPENVFRMDNVKDTDIGIMERLNYINQTLELCKGFRIVKRK